MDTYRVRLATPEDVPTLMQLRVEAEQWLSQMGIDQWSDPDLGDRAIQSWRQKIDQGRTWVFINDADKISATVSRGQADEDFWHQSDDPNSAMYVYKLIVSRTEAGNQLGGRILDWASLIAAAEGKSWLRLDVWRNNIGLQRYYQKNAFDHVRTEAPQHRLSGWLGQRAAGTVLYPERLLPLIQKPIPSDLDSQLTELQAEIKALALRVSKIRTEVQTASTPGTGIARWGYDQTLEHLVVLDRHMRGATDEAASAVAQAQKLPEPTDLAWASAPRRPVQSWQSATR